MTKYWAAVYARDKTSGELNIRWRMRDMEEHPCDPGWERGDCSVCHQPVRERAAAGDVLFDIVFPRDAKSDAPRVVRSAIPIGEVEDDKLQFDSYIFLDGNWRDGISAVESEAKFWLSGAALWRGRGALTERTAVDWLEKMSDTEAYTVYEAGQCPHSVPDEHWEEMIRRCPLNSVASKGPCPSKSSGGSNCWSERTCTKTC